MKRDGENGMAAEGRGDSHGGWEVLCEDGWGGEGGGGGGVVGGGGGGGDGRKSRRLVE